MPTKVKVSLVEFSYEQKNTDNKTLNHRKYIVELSINCKNGVFL